MNSATHKPKLGRGIRVAEGPGAGGGVAATLEKLGCRWFPQCNNELKLLHSNPEKRVSGCAQTWLGVEETSPLRGYLERTSE